MQPVFRIAGALQAVLTTAANRIAKSSGAIQRERKFSGASLAQTFVFGWLNNPAATLDELAQMAACCGTAVSPQAIGQRLTSKLADFFKQLLEVATAEVVSSQAMASELLQRFRGVYLQDSTVISLPDSFAQEYPGCGGGTGETSAALKLQVQLNLANGAIKGPFPEAGKASDRASRVQSLTLPAGALRIADLGYFDLSVLAEMAVNMVFWISRIQVHTAVFHEGKQLDICSWLDKRHVHSMDLSIELGASERLGCRLLAVRCPPEVVRRRIASLEKDARRRGRTPSKIQRRSCHWTIVVTNVPADRLNLLEAMVLYRARWQIELLFKLWKQHGLVDESRHQADAAKLVEIYAKLIGLVIQHWLLITTIWSYSNRSLIKASKAIRKHVMLLAAAFQSLITIEAAVGQIIKTLQKSARINHRKRKPNTHQILENPELLEYDLA
jgi:hypothetical protein